MAKSRLHELSEHGQSVWIDSLSRDMLRSGELARLMEEDAVVGVTSNPTIFAKALGESEDYAGQVDDLALRGIGVEEAARLITTGPRRILRLSNRWTWTDLITTGHQRLVALA